MQRTYEKIRRPCDVRLAKSPRYEKKIRLQRPTGVDDVNNAIAVDQTKFRWQFRLESTSRETWTRSAAVLLHFCRAEENDFRLLLVHVYVRLQQLLSMLSSMM